MTYAQRVSDALSALQTIANLAWEESGLDRGSFDDHLSAVYAEIEEWAGGMVYRIKAERRIWEAHRDDFICDEERDLRRVYRILQELRAASREVAQEYRQDRRNEWKQLSESCDHLVREADKTVKALRATHGDTAMGITREDAL